MISPATKVRRACWPTAPRKDSDRKTKSSASIRPERSSLGVDGIVGTPLSGSVTRAARGVCAPCQRLRTKDLVIMARGPVGRPGAQDGKRSAVLREEQPAAALPALFWQSGADSLTGGRPGEKRRAVPASNPRSAASARPEQDVAQGTAGSRLPPSD